MVATHPSASPFLKEAIMKLGLRVRRCRSLLVRGRVKAVGRGGRKKSSGGRAHGPRPKSSRKLLGNKGASRHMPHSQRTHALAGSISLPLTIEQVLVAVF